jgi:hypothetical protein
MSRRSYGSVRRSGRNRDETNSRRRLDEHRGQDGRRGSDVGHRTEVPYDRWVVWTECVRGETVEVHRGDEDRHGLVEELSTTIRMDVPASCLEKKRLKRDLDLDLLSDGGHRSKDHLGVAVGGFRDLSVVAAKRVLLGARSLSSLAEALRIRGERLVDGGVRVGILGLGSREGGFRVAEGSMAAGRRVGSLCVLGLR